MTIEENDGTSTTGEPSAILLDAGKVTKRFGGLVGNREVDFVIPRTSTVSLIGPH